MRERNELKISNINLFEISSIKLRKVYHNQAEKDKIITLLETSFGNFGELNLRFPIRMKLYHSVNRERETLLLSIFTPQLSVRFQTDQEGELDLII